MDRLRIQARSLVEAAGLGLLATAVLYLPPASIAALRTRGVTHVSVNCELIGHTCRELLDRIAARPEFRRVKTASWQDRPALLYELVR